METVYHIGLVALGLYCIYKLVQSAVRSMSKSNKELRKLRKEQYRKEKEVVDQFEDWSKVLRKTLEKAEKDAPKRLYTFPPCSGDKVVFGGRVCTLFVKRNQDGSVSKGTLVFENGEERVLDSFNGVEPLVN
jgi:hypothetical protein